MSLDKAIEHNKEYRKPYRGGKVVATSCRNHGWCPWCQGNRHYRTNRLEEKTKRWKNYEFR